MNDNMFQSQKLFFLQKVIDDFLLAAKRIGYMTAKLEVRDVATAQIHVRMACTIVQIFRIIVVEP